MLTVAVFGGSSQTILRPSEMEDTFLAEKLEQKALYDADRIFVRTGGTDAGIEDGKLVVKQKGREGRLIQLDCRGGILFRLPLERNAENRLGVIVTETVQEYLQKALRYAIWLLDEIDSTQRLSHPAVVSSLAGGMGMITRAELRASPNALSISGFGNQEPAPVHLDPPHVAWPALSQDIERIVSDLVTLLRRQRR